MDREILKVKCLSRHVYLKGNFKVHRINGQSMYRNVLFLNYAQIAINTNVSETSKLGDISVFWLSSRIFR